MKIFIILSLSFLSLNALSSTNNCVENNDLKPICPSSSWKIRKKVRDMNYEPVVWTKHNKNKKINLLFAKMKRQNIKSIDELKNLAITQFGYRKFHWEKELVNENNFVLAKISDSNKEHQFLQGYLKNSKGTFYSLNCMSSSKKVTWNECESIVNLISSGIK